MKMDRSRSNGSCASTPAFMHSSSKGAVLPKNYHLTIAIKPHVLSGQYFILPILVIYDSMLKHSSFKITKSTIPYL